MLLTCGSDRFSSPHNLLKMAVCAISGRGGQPLERVHGRAIRLRRLAGFKKSPAFAYLITHAQARSGGADAHRPPSARRRARIVFRPPLTQHVHVRSGALGCARVRGALLGPESAPLCDMQVARVIDDR